MFNKLKSFSEDVAKSFNEIQQGEPTRKSIDNIRQLKNGSNILNTKTPDSHDLLQPEDDNESKNGSQTQLPQEGQAEDTAAQTASPIATSGPLKDIDMEQLPQLVRAKLKKFVKYEEKYPVLLDAYKTEKRKGELVLAFEKVLKEFTPVSLIADAGELVEYLKSIHDKTSIMEQELRKKTAEVTQLTRRLADADKTVKYTEEALDKALKVKDSLSSEVESLRMDLLNATRDASPQASEVVSEFQKSIDALKEQLGSAQTNLEDATKEKERLAKDLEKSKTELSSVQKELDLLKNDGDGISGQLKDLQLERETLTKELESIKHEKDTLRSNCKTLEEEKNILQAKVSDLESKIADTDKRIEEIQKERDDAQSKSVQAPARESETQSQTRSSGNKRKKNKKSKAQSASPVPEPQTADANSGASEFKAKFEELTRKYDDLVAEKESLAIELRKSKRLAESKKEEIESLNDMLRETGNDLVAAKDEIKQLKLDFPSNEELEKYNQLEKQLEESSKELDKIRRESEEKSERLRIEHAEQVEKIRQATIESLQQSSREEIETLKSNSEKASGMIKDLKGQLSRANKDLEESKKEIESLNQEKAKLNQRIDELAKAKSVDSSLKLEIASLQSSVSHKDELIKEFREESERRAKERDTLKATISQLENSNSSLQGNNKSLVQEKSDLINKQEVTNQRITSLNAELSKLQVSRHEVVKELDELKTKFETMVKTKASSSDEVQSYKQQYEELSMKSKEAQNRIETLEDELSEAKLMLQERTRESSTIRKLLLEAEERNNIECANLKNDIRSINAERSELESSLQGALKQRQREIDELKSSLSESSSKIKHLTDQLDGLKKKYEPLINETATSPEAAKKTKDLENTIEELRNSLQSSSAKVKEYENMNRTLKKLNEESSLKVERLLQNYKHVTQQYRQMQSSKATPPESTRSSSELPVAKSTPDKDTNTAYLKNVLFGFFEHKEQREQLLPVVKTLFQLDDSDEAKLMNALK